MASRTVLAALFFGGVCALATPPTNIAPAAWMGMAGLAFLLHEDDAPNQKRLRWLLGGGLRGWAFGVGVNAVALRFVPTTIARFTPLPYAAGWLALLLLAMFQAVVWMFAMILARHLVRLGVRRWVAFGIGTYVSTFVPVVFPWTVAAGTTALPSMIQLSEVIGERGIAALMAITAAMAAEVAAAAIAGANRRAALWTVATAMIPALMAIEGTMRIKHVDAAMKNAPHVRVGLVQPSTEARTRWVASEAPMILKKLTSLTQSAEAKGADIVIWPEAAYPYPLPLGSQWDTSQNAILQFGVRGPVLTGVMMDGSEGGFNSAIIADAGKISAPYHKMHLLAFGEAVPLSKEIPWLRRTFQRGTGLVPGDAQVLLRWHGVRAAVLNCFEDTLPEAGREAAAMSPNLLVNITNDAWFAETAESELHLRLAIVRAVETRLDLVRAVNYGPTSWVDAAGRVRLQYDGALPASIIAEPALLESRTPYTRFGDIPWLVLAAVHVAIAALKRRRDVRLESGTPPAVLP